jgi:hypothetical protein
MVNEITPKDLVASIARFAVRMDTVADRCARVDPSHVDEIWDTRNTILPCDLRLAAPGPLDDSP